MEFRDFDINCAALCAWREARGEGADGIRAVLHVINNRSKQRNKSWAFIVYERLQFSSMTYKNDPQLCLVPDAADQRFKMCQALAQSVYDGQDDDLTAGSDHYFAPATVLPSWASTMTFKKRIGHHDFYQQ